MSGGICVSIADMTKNSKGPPPLARGPAGLKLLPEKETHLCEFSITHNKIAPIYRFLQDHDRASPRPTPYHTSLFCEMWIGISAEENLVVQVR